MKKIKLYAIFSISLILIGVLTYLVLDRKLNKEFATRSTPLSSAERFDWEIPDLPKGYIWDEDRATEEELSKSRMWFDNRFANVRPEDQEGGSFLPKSGKIYKTFVQIESSISNIHDDTRRFREAVDEVNTDNGWLLSIRLNEYEVGGMAADGVGGSLWGYIKVNDYMIRTITYGYEAYECVKQEFSCKINFFIIVSDPVDIRDSIMNL